MADRTPAPVPPAAPSEVYDDACRAWEAHRAGSPSRLVAAIDTAYATGVAVGEARGRTAAAADIEAERVKRAKTACCDATGYCGDRECQIDCAVDDALDAAAKLAEGTDHAG